MSASAETTYTFTGGGKGHAVGLCMSGVLYAANQGLNYNQILPHYYTGVTIGARGGVDASLIRAKVYSAAWAFGVKGNGTYQVKNSSGTVIKSLLSGSTITVTYKGGGTYEIKSQTQGTCTVTGGMVNLEPLTTTKFTFPNGLSYQGKIRVVVPTNEGVTAVNILSIDSYLKGLAEEPDSWPTQGLQTLAIASRTYAYRRTITNASSSYDIDNNGLYYIGVRTAPNYAKAVNDTRDVIITYQGSPITAAYSGSCGGHTENIEDVWGGSPVAYLKARPCNWCKTIKWYRWGPLTYSKSRLEAIFKSHGVDVGSLIDIDISNRSAGGHVRKARIIGTAKTVTVWGYSQLGSWLAFYPGVNSSLYWISKSGSTPSPGTSPTPSKISTASSKLYAARRVVKIKQPFGLTFNTNPPIARAHIFVRRRVIGIKKWGRYRKYRTHPRGFINLVGRIDKSSVYEFYYPGNRTYKGVRKRLVVRVKR